MVYVYQTRLIRILYFVSGCLCRSEDEELDHYIFNMFDLCENGKIMLVEITMMLVNFPDMGFSNS